MTIEYKLYAVRIWVSDLARAVAFYRDTLGMPLFFESQEMGWAQVEAGGAYLGLERADAEDTEAQSRVGRFVGASLSVDDIEACHKTLAARGVQFVQTPAKQPWGGWLAHFRDPDGNVLTLLGS